MRLIINLVLVALIAALGYLLFYGIREPIAFKDTKTERLDAVTDRLKQIRYAQEFYRDITGKFAPSFDSLKYVLERDSFTLVKIIGNPDDPNGDFVRTEKKRSAKDSIAYLLKSPDSKIKIVLDSLRFVPYSGGAEFEIQADTLTYQKTLVNVTQVSTRWKTFMGSKFGDIKYARYDNTYDPANLVRFGDMSAPNLSGNWE
ncbi:MAG: hypothetical protein AAF573_17795 [Bacteroidota bacterium]